MALYGLSLYLPSFSATFRSAEQIGAAEASVGLRREVLVPPFRLPPVSLLLPHLRVQGCFSR
jgi:hypothetical protein